MKRIIVSIINILLLSSCTFSADSYFIRWWNGDIPAAYSSEEEEISNICHKETSHLPQNTHEERDKASLEYIKCFRKKEKEFGVK